MKIEFKTVKQYERSMSALLSAPEGSLKGPFQLVIPKKIWKPMGLKPGTKLGPRKRVAEPVIETKSKPWKIHNEQGKRTISYNGKIFKVLKHDD